MRPLKIAGQKFGRYLVLGKTSIKYTPTKWLCQCDCGNIREVVGANLMNGNSMSCGCMTKERMKTEKTTHNLSKTPEHISWCAAKGRCYNPSNRAYKNYGGRGIEMCEKWLNSFDNFLADMGKRPSPNHSLDRFPDMNGNYEPNNCRWATRKEQAANIRTNRWIEYNGKKMILEDWLRFLKIPRNNVHRFLRSHTISELFNKYKPMHPAASVELVVD